MASSSHGGARGRFSSHHPGISPYDTTSSLFFKHAGQSTNRPQTVFDRRSHALSHTTPAHTGSGSSTQRNREMALQRLHQTISSGHNDPSIARYTYGYRPGSISLAFRATTAADSLRPDVAGIRGRGGRPLTAEQQYTAMMGRPLTAENFSSAGRPLTATTSYANPPSRLHSYETMASSFMGSLDTEEDAMTLVGGEPPAPKDKLWTMASSIIQQHQQPPRQRQQQQQQQQQQQLPHPRQQSSQRQPPSHAAAANLAAGLIPEDGPLRLVTDTRPHSAAIGGSSHPSILLHKNGGIPMFRPQHQEPPGGLVIPPHAQFAHLVPNGQNLSGSALYSSMRLPRLEMDPFSFEGSRGAWMADADLASRVGVSSVKGRRLYMEDEYKVINHLEALGPSEGHLHPSIKTSFWAVFDGHAGGSCSKTLAQTLAPTLVKELDFHTDIRGAIIRGFQRANTDFLKKADKYQMNDGSTAATAFYRDGKLWVANVGDSRVVLCSKGKAVAMSQDHKPSKPDERRRIMSLGGKVVNCFGVARVNGVLAVARAFGNRTMRSVIRADAEISERVLADGDDFLVLASDGLWDTMANQEVADIVSRCADKLGLQACAELLTATSIRKGSMDNTSVVLVDLRPYRAASTVNVNIVAASRGGPMSNHHGPHTTESSVTTASSPNLALTHTRRHSTGELHVSPATLTTRDLSSLRVSTAPHGAGRVAVQSHSSSMPSPAPTSTDKSHFHHNKL